MDNREKEILLIIQEECAEVIQAISKVLRFGIESKHPSTGITNKSHLEEELGDLMAVVTLLSSETVLVENVASAMDRKIEKLKKWSNIFN